MPCFSWYRNWRKSTIISCNYTRIASTTTILIKSDCILIRRPKGINIWWINIVISIIRSIRYAPFRKSISCSRWTIWELIGFIIIGVLSLCSSVIWKFTTIWVISDSNWINYKCYSYTFSNSSMIDFFKKTGACI